MVPEAHRPTLDVSKLTPRKRPEHLQVLPVSPHAQACDAQALRTVQQLGILRNSESLTRYAKTKLASLSGMWFPSARKEIVQVCTDVNWWVATYDDRVDGDLMTGNSAVLVFHCCQRASMNVHRTYIYPCVQCCATMFTGDVAAVTEENYRIALIQQIVAVFSSPKEEPSGCADNMDPHVLYAVHIHRQLKDLQISERFEPAMRDVLLRSSSN